MKATGDEVLEAEFVKSSTTLSQLPPANLAEYAFIGRSNVGKSSLLNMLVGRKSLAKTSGQPGKTQTINHFKVENRWYIVDLPGYGFAKTSQTNREQWNKMIKEYLGKRENLLCVFLLIDINVPPQKNDVEFMQWLAQAGVPFVITFTKADRQTINKNNQNIALWRKTLSKDWAEMPQYFLTSSETGFGRDEVLSFISELNEGFQS